MENRDIQHSTRLLNHKTQHQSFQQQTLRTRQARRQSKTWAGWCSSLPSASGSTFFVGNRPVKVCKKLALSVCEDMRLPQRSMAYEWDECNGDNKVSGGATRWGCPFFLPQSTETSVCWVFCFVLFLHILDIFVITHTYSHMRTQNSKTQDRDTTPEYCTHNLRQADIFRALRKTI